MRIVVIAVLAVVWAGAARLFGGDAISALFNSLVVMLYLLVTWTAINLVDYFFVRRGRYAILDLLTPTGIYGAWGRRGLIAYVVGLASMMPFIVIPGWVTAPGAQALGGADVSAIIGLAVSAGAYLLLTRSLDHAAEEPAIQASERVISETMP
jgi:purine-cytosine permease-like protein